ncbi:SDR family oxidoreductase [Luteibacter sp. ME-Dv--P-043b]|uniref:SDR family oxidoreductase n=1 Tax=Luteibacter sp. ME-Dv--P-043b TaxID=3040291 RepID=UPI002556BF94|nr:SDR family oxidoreductase [Luteibacter sp. ME-Dv--P-043b]
MNALSKKKVVVIGGGSGMGLEVAHQAASAGSEVVLFGRSETKLKQAAETIPGQASWKSVDIGDEDSVRRAFSTLDGVDHVVSTAASLTFAPIDKVSTAQIEDMLASKFWGPLFAAKHAAPLLRAGGSITFLSGLAAYRPGPGATIVAALNAALEGMAMGLALELKPVRVNVVSPGVIDTPTWDFLSAGDRQAMFDSIASQLPVGRVGQANDIAEAVLSVMTNGFINATVIHVDGGGRVA